MADRIAYYLTEYTDEWMPCDCSLEGWAKWLSEPSEDYNRDVAASDGDTFSATRGEITYHTMIGRLDDGAPKFEPALPSNFDLVARCFGFGQGWDADSICDDVSQVEESEPLEEGEMVAALVHDPVAYLVTYRSEPPRCEATPAAA